MWLQGINRPLIHFTNIYVINCIELNIAKVSKFALQILYWYYEWYNFYQTLQVWMVIKFILHLIQCNKHNLHVWFDLFDTILQFKYENNDKSKIDVFAIDIFQRYIVLTPWIWIQKWFLRAVSLFAAKSKKALIHYINHFSPFHFKLNAQLNHTMNKTIKR